MVHSGGMPRLVTVGLWLVFTAVAVLTGLGAVAIVRGAVTGDGAVPLSAEQVSQQLRSGDVSPTPTVTPSHPHHATATPTGSPGPRPSHHPSSSATAQPTQSSGPGHRSAVVRSIGSRGGTVVAACTSGQVYLRSWSPAAGFIVDSYDRGPGTTASIKFASADSATGETEVELSVTCAGGVPTAASDTRGETD